MRKNSNAITKTLAVATMALLAACTPADIDYCNQFGVAGTAEFSKCIAYYQQEEAAFGADRAVCSAQADETYPQTLYDRGGFAHVGIGGFGGLGGRFHGPGLGYGGGIVSVPPNYYHNAEVDRLRARIITPCMQARGWNSPNSWQAGRSEVKPTKRKASKPAYVPEAPTEKLPWLQ